MQFADFPPGTDGATGWIGRDPYAMVALRLSDAEAEATVLLLAVEAPVDRFCPESHQRVVGSAERSGTQEPGGR